MKRYNNGHDDYLLNVKTNAMGDRWLPSQGAMNAEKVSIGWTLDHTDEDWSHSP